MNTLPPRFAAFSDESRYNAGRFRSIATVSLSAERVVPVETTLSGIVAAHGMRELHWSQLKGEREGGCAIEFLDILFDAVLPSGGRVDVLTWDVHDRRHAVARRDDTRNYERMYYHLHRYVMRLQTSGSEWHLRPDEQVSIDWARLGSCLDHAGRPKSRRIMTLLSDWSQCERFEVGSLRPVRSHEHPLCQLADLFAGMAPYTRDRAAVMQRLHEAASGQLSLFDSETPKVKVSRKDTERFAVISHLLNRCRERRLGVSFRERWYLWSPAGAGPINFWHYAPQTDDDKAPTKARKGLGWDTRRDRERVAATRTRAAHADSRSR